MNTRIYFLAIVMAGVMLSPGCTHKSVPEKSLTSLSKEIPEIHPGILRGYLSSVEYPSSLRLLDPPPEEGSTAFALDREIAARYVAMEDEDRRMQAAADAVLHFPEATGAFNIVLDSVISEEATPHVYMIMRRTLADAGLATYAAKNYYKRYRPFMVNNTPSCTPDSEEALRKDGSYPSGHTAIGWVWALILAEVFPDKCDDILVRGMEFGISRCVCNVHWTSDVVAGRLIGTAVVARLHSNEDFLIDLQAAKQEVMALSNK